MKRIKALLCPETTDNVIEGLSEGGFISLTKIDAPDRGKQNGITIGVIHYDELPKTMLILVVEDECVEEVVKIIKYKAYTVHQGDGKIFVIPVDNAYMIRTGDTGL